jgi:hypothetical protein
MKGLYNFFRPYELATGLKVGVANYIALCAVFAGMTARS